MAASLLCLPTPSPSTSISKFIADQPHLKLLETQCATMKDLRKLHASLIKTGRILDKIAASRVLTFSASTMGDMNYAYLVFTQIHDKNLFVWNTIIRGFSRSSSPEQAIYVFIDMLEDSSVQPQRLTYPSVFKAYGDLGFARDGTQLHGRVIKEGIQSDPFVRNTILHMYANCGFWNEAWRVFDGFDVVAWNSMIMSLAKRGLIEKSQELFDEMPERNTVSWNSMISGYVRKGQFREALELFREMQEKKIEPTEFTMVSLLNACASVGAIRQGQWIHDYMKRKNFEFNGIIVTAVIDMYCKCGCIEKGLEVFEGSTKENLSNWNAMMLGLANNGFEEEATQLFSKLGCWNLEPDSVSFIAVLTACGHSGMIEEAREYFSSMAEKYQIKPSIKHYTCMVDALGRAGLLEEAESLIDTMPLKPDAIIWSSLLSSCRTHGNIEMAQRVARHILDLDSDGSCGYMLISNSYAACNRFGDAIEQRVLMKNKEIKKEPGCSSIEIDLEVHEFVSGGRMNSKSPEMYMLLHLLNWNMTVEIRTALDAVKDNNVYA